MWLLYLETLVRGPSLRSFNFKFDVEQELTQINNIFTLFGNL